MAWACVKGGSDFDDLSRVFSLAVWLKIDVFVAMGSVADDVARGAHRYSD